MYFAENYFRTENKSCCFVHAIKLPYFDLLRFFFFEKGFLCAALDGQELAL